MKFKPLLIICLILLSSCNIADNSSFTSETAITSTGKESLPSSFTPESQNIVYATKILSTRGCVSTRWISDQQILGNQCSLPNGDVVDWGLINPNSDTFITINGPDYFFTQEEQNMYKIAGDEIDNFIISPSNNFVLVEMKKINQAGISTKNIEDNYIYTLLLYSRTEKKATIIPWKNFKNCNQKIDNFVSWSDDERYITADCWVNFDEAKTTILLDLSTETFYDLMVLVGTTKPINAILSNNSSVLAINDFDKNLYIFSMSSFPKLTLTKTMKVNYPNIMLWMNDNKSIVMDNTDKNGDYIVEIDVNTEKMHKILNYSSIFSTQTGEKLEYFTGVWAISPNNDNLLLNYLPDLWIYRLN